MQEKNEEQILRNRTILLKHANNVCSWINNWTVGDIHKNTQKKEIPTEMLNFNEFADATLKEVHEVFEKLKDNKL